MCTFSKCNEVLKFAKLLKCSANDLFVTCTCDTVCRQHRFIYKCQREQQIEITDIAETGMLGPCIYCFFLFRFQICERKTDNEFVFRFQICERKTNSFFVFKSEVRKTNQFFVFKCEVRKTKNEFVFRFQICERKTNSFFVFKSEVRKTNSFFVFKCEVRKTKNEFVFRFQM